MTRRWLFPGLKHEQVGVTSLQQCTWAGGFPLSETGILPTSLPSDMMRVSYAPKEGPRIPTGFRNNSEKQQGGGVMV